MKLNHNVFDKKYAFFIIFLDMKETIIKNLLCSKLNFKFNEPYAYLKIISLKTRMSSIVITMDILYRLFHPESSATQTL